MPDTEHPLQSPVPGEAVSVRFIEAFHAPCAWCGARETGCRVGVEWEHDETGEQMRDAFSACIACGDRLSPFDKLEARP